MKGVEIQHQAAWEMLRKTVDYEYWSILSDWARSFMRLMMIRKQFTKSIIQSIFLLTLPFISQVASAHDFESAELKGTARYLANEGVVIESGESKLMFDPFFHNDYGHYALVPEEMRKAIFENRAPYDNINAVFISHAHGDHFDAADTVKYLLSNSNVTLFAPKQATDQLIDLKGYDKVKSRINSVDLKKDQAAKQFEFGDMLVEAVRIPHAGWPQRADIENIVFRVGGKKQIRVMHFGDADPHGQHYAIHEKFWRSKRTDISFVPFWFGLTESGKRLIESGLNTEKAIGVHVPTKLPEQLKKTDFDFFHKPGETKIISRSEN